MSVMIEIATLLALTWVTKCGASSTITAINPFNAKEDADKLLAAVDGIGTDEEAFALLTKRTCEQRAEIRKARDDIWLTSIKDDFILDSKTLNVILSSFYCGPSFYRYQFKQSLDAEDAAGMAEMLSILSMQPDVLETAKKEFFEVEQVTLEDALGQTFDEQFVNWCCQVIMLKRDVKGAVDQALAEKEAGALLASVPNWKTDRAKLNECLLKPSFMQTREILAKFKQQNKEMDLATTITKAQLDDETLTMAYLALIQDVSDELLFITTRLKTVTDEGDTLGLTRLIVGRSEIDLLEATQKYQDMYKIPLAMKIQEMFGGIQGLLGGTAPNLLTAYLGDAAMAAIKEPEKKEEPKKQ